MKNPAVIVDIKFRGDDYKTGTVTFPSMDEFAKFVIANTDSNAKTLGRTLMFHALTEEEIYERTIHNCLFDQNEQKRIGIYPNDFNFIDSKRLLEATVGTTQQIS